MQEQLHQVARKAIDIQSGLRKIAPREFMDGDKFKHARVDDRAQGLDCIPHTSEFRPRFGL